MVYTHTYTTHFTPQKTCFSINHQIAPTAKMLRAAANLIIDIIGRNYRE